MYIYIGSWRAGLPPPLSTRLTHDDAIFTPERPPPTRTAPTQPQVAHRRRHSSPTTTDKGNTIPHRANPKTA